MRRVAGLAVLSLALATSARARAQSEAQIPAECGSPEEFDREVRARLGEQAAPLPTRLWLEPDGDRFVLRMSVGGEQRALRERNCRELFRAAVVVAVAITLSQAKPKAKPSPPPEPPPPESPPPESTDEAASDGGSGFFVAAALGGGAHAGVAPNVTPVVEVEGRLGASSFGAALGARYLAPASSSDGAGRGVEVSGVGGEVSALFVPTPLFEARLGARAFRLFGTGLGSEAQQSDGAWSAGLVAGAGFYPLQRGRLWGGVAASGEWHLVRSRFEILNYGEVFRVSRFGGSALARFGLRFF